MARQPARGGGMVTGQIDTCISPRPVVGLPLATEFNEVVAINLKQCEGGWISHLVDHVSRYSAAALIKSKRKEVIIEHILKIWVSVFGTPSSHFSNNGGEFNSEGTP